MTITTTELRKNMAKHLNSVSKYNDIINVSTKNGGVVIISEDEYRGMMETLYLESIPGLEEEILKRAAAPESEFVSEEEIKW